ncbi:MAG: permease, partial [Betaproteobacteria bacterium]
TNSVAGNLAGVAFGVVMYFPTLVEVPIAKMFLDLGMHRGPLLAYLMADPELSLQSILIISAIIGRRKTAAYVGLVALFSAVAGFAYGAWVDGVPPLLIALSVGAFVAALAFGVSRAGATRHATPQGT